MADPENNENGGCFFCMPNTDLIVDAFANDTIGLRMTAEAIELLGTKLECGKEMTICEPLMIIQRRIDHIERQRKKKK